MAGPLRARPAAALRCFQLAMGVADQAVAAFGRSADEGGHGASVVRLAPESTVTATVKTRPRYAFAPDAKYLIAVEAPAVDVADLTSLRDVLTRLAGVMPPVRGCIQATVVLRDNLFPNMSHDDWVANTCAKVTASWNLHLALPAGLDFFVLISSLNGIFGGRGQANYGVGNTFKDALAEHRLRLGQRAVSIDLGLMVAEGIVAENAQLLASMRRLGHLMDIQQHQLLALLDHYCDLGLALLPPADAQVLVGIELPQAVLAKGIELHHAVRRPMFRHLFQMRRTWAPGDGNASTPSLAAPPMTPTADRADGDEAAAALVLAWFAAKLAQVMGLAADDVQVEWPVHRHGIDSLVAIDLKNWFTREMGADIDVFALLGNASLEEVADRAARTSRFRHRRRDEEELLSEGKGPL